MVLFITVRVSTIINAATGGCDRNGCLRLVVRDDGIGQLERALIWRRIGSWPHTKATPFPSHASVSHLIKMPREPFSRIANPLVEWECFQERFEFSMQIGMLQREFNNCFQIL